MIIFIIVMLLAIVACIIYMASREIDQMIDSIFDQRNDDELDS